MLEMTLTEFREFIANVDFDLFLYKVVSMTEENKLVMGEFGDHETIVFYHDASMVILKAMIKGLSEARLISLINNLVYETGLDDNFNRVYPFQVVEG